LQEITSEVLKSAFYLIKVFFGGFAVCSVIFVLLSLLLKKNSWIYRFDEISVKFITTIGLIYVFFWLISDILVFCSFFGDETRTTVINRMTGKYWYGYWMQGLTWILLSQALRFEKVKKSSVVRLIFSFIFYFTFEYMIIYITSLHRDYSSMSWDILSIIEIISSLLTKVIIYLIFLGLFYAAIELIKKFKFATSKN
jgi:hypothetical protein